jgi:hypothetical protein
MPAGKRRRFTPSQIQAKLASAVTSWSVRPSSSSSCAFGAGEMKRLGANINGVAEELLGAHLTTEPTAGFVQGDGVPSADQPTCGHQPGDTPADHCDRSLHHRKGNLPDSVPGRLPSCP